MMAESKDTKRKILDSAGELFAKNGFGATSVRDISQHADVNLASINYHFKNKENLYWMVFEDHHNWMNAQIQKLEVKKLDPPELAVEVYRFFIANGPAVMNTFKIFLSDNVFSPEQVLGDKEDERFGPPGNEVFISALDRVLGPEVSSESKYWAMKMSFSLIVHFAVMMSTSIMKRKCSTEEELSPERMEKSVYNATKSHLEYIQKNPNLF